MNTKSSLYLGFLPVLSLIAWFFVWYNYSKYNVQYSPQSVIPFQLKWEERELMIQGFKKPIKYIFGQWNPPETHITNEMRQQMQTIHEQNLAWQPIPDDLEKNYRFTYEELEELTNTGNTQFSWYRQTITTKMEEALLDFLSSKALKYVIESCYSDFVQYGDPMWRDDTTWINPHWININDFLSINPNTWRKKIHYELVENIMYQVTNDNIPIKKCLQDKWVYKNIESELSWYYNIFIKTLWK